MQGAVINIDRCNGGLIRGEDGKRYQFGLSDCKSTSTACLGDTVDFEVENGRAIDLYVIRSQGSTFDAERIRGAARSLAGASAGLIGSAAGSVQAILASSGKDGGPGSRRHAAEFPGLDDPKDWRMIIGGASLLACMMPVVSFGGGSFSVYGVSSVVGSVVDASRQLQLVFGGLTGGNPWSTGNRPVNVVGQLSGIIGLLHVAYALYLIPVLGALVCLWPLRARSNARLAVLHGFACLAPLALVGCASTLVQASLTARDAQMVAAMGGTLLGAAGSGAWILALLGIAQLLVGFGYIQRSPRSLLAGA